MTDGSTRTRANVSNILVIGCGAAGLRAAIAAHEAGSEAVVIGTRPRKDAHTVLAAGGINAALGTRDPEDSWQQHFADTLKEGYNLSDPKAVEIVAKEAPRAVHELAEWGAPFARTPSGELDQRFFGAHKYRRTCYAGDYTGRAMLFALVDKSESLGIPVHEGQYVSKLLVHDGRCFGAYAFDVHSGERTVYLADAVVLATGGHTRLWRVSSSRRDENTGSGMYLALEAGCRLSDMELVQFHPTGMVYPEEWVGTLATEAIRGEGGRLYNADGERYMQRYDPERMELSTRDRIALANYTEIVEGRGSEHGGVYLDISDRPKRYILEKLPRMYRQFLEASIIDISKSPIEVAPTAHYTMGGIVVEPETHATGVEGLYAAGENTSGLHGANRLGGNSLSETVVFGRRAGEAAAEFSRNADVQLRDRAAIREAAEEVASFIKEGEEFARPLQRDLRNTMQETCGVVRSEEKLTEGLRRLAEIREASNDVDVRPTSEGLNDLAYALDLRGSLVVAEATILGAIERRETRGAHNRCDYPELDPNMKVNFVVQKRDDGLAVAEEPVHTVPEYLEEWAKSDEEYEVAGRLVE
ncbi:MAG: FAD-binding protein [Actinomycetota bacterium]|nr:FAD-binding protein [Actinomycetota bacterium]